MKRQIIKTRSETPYRFARWVIALALVAVAVWLAYRFWWAPAHAAHAAASSIAYVQDLIFFSMNPLVPVATS